MDSGLLQRVRTYKNRKIVSQSLLFAFFGCQADRRAPKFAFEDYGWFGFLRNLFLVVISLIFLQSQGESAPGRGPMGLIWEAPLESEETYTAEVEALIRAYEAERSIRLTPGQRGKVGIKVNTRSGRGLSTPLGLLRAVIEAFEKRGFERQGILILDYSVHGLREAGILPVLSTDEATFEGCSVYALDSEQYYDKDWFYDSPLPPSRNQDPKLLQDPSVEATSLSEGDSGRKSFLPMPLLFEVDFWVNLALGVDDGSLGIDGALANATLWNVSNSQRFLSSEATASVAVAEIAAIPELSERMLLHFVPLNRYQYIGGPQFNSLYTYSEPLLWMSADPVAIDRLLFDRINTLRRNNGFPEIDALPRQLPFASSLGLGVFEKSQIEVREVGFER